MAMISRSASILQLCGFQRIGSNLSYFSERNGEVAQQKMRHILSKRIIFIILIARLVVTTFAQGNLDDGDRVAIEKNVPFPNTEASGGAYGYHEELQTFTYFSEKTLMNTFCYTLPKSMTTTNISFLLRTMTSQYHQNATELKLPMEIEVYVNDGLQTSRWTFVNYTDAGTGAHSVSLGAEVEENISFSTPFTTGAYICLVPTPMPAEGTKMSRMVTLMTIVVSQILLFSLIVNCLLYNIVVLKRENDSDHEIFEMAQQGTRDLKKSMPEEEDVNEGDISVQTVKERDTVGWRTNVKGDEEKGSCNKWRQRRRKGCHKDRSKRWRIGEEPYSDGADPSTDESNGGGHQSRSGSSTKDDFQFRADILRLGVTSWDHKYNPDSTLVLGDLTSSTEQIHFVFFHLEAVSALFGCGLECSIVSICLNTQKVFMKGITKELWKKYWMDSCHGALRPFLFGRVKEGLETNPAIMQTKRLRLTAEEALSRFGVSLDEPQPQVFVNLGTPSRHEVRSWIPSWKVWIQSVINLASPTEPIRDTLPAKVRGWFVRTAPVSTKSLNTGEETSSMQNGHHALGEQSGEDANLRVTSKFSAGAGEEQRALVVEISFHSTVHPYYAFNADGEPCEQLANERCYYPGGRSEIAPSMTLEFSFLSPEEKMVATTLHGLYCMDPKPQWHSDWFQDDLRLSFGSVENDNALFCRRGSPQISGKTFSPMERMYHDGRSICEEKGKGFQAGLMGGVPYASTLENHSLFDVTCVGNQCKMDVRAKFQFDSMEPSKLYFTHPERYREAYSSGLQSEFNLNGKIIWEVFGAECHAYDFLSRKTLSRSSKFDINADKAEEKRSIFRSIPKLPWRESSSLKASGETGGESEAKGEVETEGFLKSSREDSF